MLGLYVALTAFSPGVPPLRARRAHPPSGARAWVGCSEAAEPAAAPAVLDELCLLKGVVQSGYGRGGKQIGVPTANLPSSALADGTIEMMDRGGGTRSGTLEAMPRGVYVAWAGLRGEVRKAVVNVGLAPTFEDAENPETIAEAHLLDPIDEDFYGEELTLLLLGFVRPERKFPRSACLAPCAARTAGGCADAGVGPCAT